MNNVEFLNSVAKTMSAEYQERIPTATQENVAEIGEMITEYPTLKNEFINALTNKVAKSKIVQKAYQNRYKFLNKGTLPYGTSIEIIVANLVKGKDYSENFGSANTEIGSLLAKEVPEVMVEYISRNIQLKYKLTINHMELMKAFTSESGLSSLINAKITSVVNSIEKDEEILINQALNKIDSPQAKITGFDTMTDTEQARVLTKTIMVNIDKMSFLSADYNKTGYETYCNSSDLVIFVTPETKANLNVDLLANTYNMEKADINARIVLVKEFSNPNTIARVIDKEVIQLWDTFNGTGHFENGDRLENHTFYHRHKILGVCNFFNSLEIIKGE